MKDRMMEKMIAFYQGNLHDIDHFLKVHAYAALIGRLEGLDPETLATLEYAAIVHDIACPLCRQKYGNADGRRQEEESPALLAEFLPEFDLPAGVRERIVYLVAHHHTCAPVDGIDYQILLEADFMVNAGEGKLSREAVETFRDRVFKTRAGLRLLEEIHLAHGERN